ncbi:winged helix DNA-binding protein [uncultured Maribacter sp.]|uniref:MarR family winged helix-turn-helix transcriptional regulator n=2 Tax=uncultured Maribacter sp. TaxID=431308 RepID=UPI002621714C|nr:winged helix DNA-binding protein [uncultured Maribacter sp.]
MKQLSYFYERPFIKNNMDVSFEQFGRLVGASAFRRISEKLYAEGDRVYKESGIDFKTVWSPVYHALACAEDKLTINDIALQVGFTHITVKNVLKELKERELVHVVINPDDGRSKLVGLSDKGITLLEELKPVWKEYSKALDSIYNNKHLEVMELFDSIELEIDKMPIIDRMRISSDKNKER